MMNEFTPKVTSLTRISKQNWPSLVYLSALVCLFLTSCATLEHDHRSYPPVEAEAAIQSEAPGNYFIGRRFYKKDYKMWGWIREPGKPWSTARLVMLNEQKKLAPDREQGRIGSDNNFEYHLQGYFSGDTVYEPASDGFYPEFVLTGYTLHSTKPPMIFRDPRSIQPEIRLLAAPR